MTMRRSHTLLATLVALACVSGAWAQSMRVQKATALREAPSANAAELRRLPIDSHVLRLPARQGAYAQVRTQDDQTGWVRMFDLSSEPAAAADTSSGASKDALRGLAGLFGSNARSSDSGTTATMGIRGLGAQDIANAQANPAELARAQANQASEQQAKLFASQAALQTREVGELVPPPKPQAP